MRVERSEQPRGPAKRQSEAIGEGSTIGEGGGDAEAEGGGGPPEKPSIIELDTERPKVRKSGT